MGQVGDSGLDRTQQGKPGRDVTALGSSVRTTHLPSRYNCPALLNSSGTGIRWHQESEVSLPPNGGKGAPNANPELL